MKKKLLIFLRFFIGLVIALSILWGFWEFIKDDNWLGVSAFATLVLAFAAALTIWQSQHIKRSERRERLLNGIVEWAEDIVPHILESDLFDIVTFEQGFVPNDAFERLFNQLKDLRIDEAKSKRILTIVREEFQALNENVETLVNKLKEQISCLTEYRRDPRSGSLETPRKNIEKLKNAATYNENIISLATAVIEKTTKIKTRDIN